MRLSYVIVTRNRRERLLRTIPAICAATPLPDESWELWIVDNGSTDGTVTAVRKHFPWARLIALPENEGMPARNHAISRAEGRYIAFLDDDSYPVGKAIPAALDYLAHRPRTAALVARVVLPDGGFEAPAFPAVTLGGASIIRKSVLTQVGAFSPEFFRQAEEYDLSFRIWAAGYRIERFEDVVFRHDKEATGRCSALTHKMDIRNNLILVERYLPRRLRSIYRRDWLRRYASIALFDGHGDSVNAALREARIWARRESSVGRRTLDEASIDSLFDLTRQAMLVAAWARTHNARSVVIADYSKNVYATYHACRLAGLKVLAVAERREAFRGQRYRSAPLLRDEDAAVLAPDGVVISTINPAQIDGRARELARRFRGPILRLWEPRYLSGERRDETGEPVAA